MAQERDLAGEAGASPDTAARSYALGLLLSRIFHPIPLNILTFVLVGFYGFDTRSTGLMWAGICILAQVLPPTVFYTVRVRQGIYADEDISVRQQRNELYLFGMLTVLLGIALLVPLGLPRPFLALLICAFVLGVSGGLINLFWKISVHAATIAASATVALLFARPLGLVLWVAALAVGWARVRTRNHTPLQVLAGLALAALIVLAVFRLVV